MDWVIDASIALAWALPDETSDQADRFLSRVSAEEILWVPALWWYEVASALAVVERRKRLTEAEGIRLIELYGMLPIKTDTVIGPGILERLRTLAREYKLSAYDSAYLELTLRKGLGLATLDKELRSAGEKAGVKKIWGQT